MITTNNMYKFKDCATVLDDMGDRLNKDITMCHKPAQIINTAKMSCDTIYVTTYN